MLLYYLFLECKFEYILAFVCVYLLLRQLARYICIKYGTTGPADVPQDGGDDEVHVEVTGQDDHADDAGLPPQGH